jgi:hypothetical protein
LVVKAQPTAPILGRPASTASAGADNGLSIVSLHLRFERGDTFRACLGEGGGRRRASQ